MVMVGNIKIERAAHGRLVLSTNMNEHPLWFNIPELDGPPDTFADSFMAMGLAGSMLKGEPLIVPAKYKISSLLWENCQIIQRILHSWNPVFKIIPIEAVTKKASIHHGGVASFFSGGVDSISAVICNEARIDSTIFVGGFDFSIDENDLPTITARNHRILDCLGKPQILVHTNQQEWGTTTGVARNFWHSGYLAAAGYLTKEKILLVPSTHTYADLAPAGSHLILDHLWSNGAKALEHVNAELNRAQKLQKIVEFPDVLAELHVCWRDADRNCGLCEKCVRTMITLDILGVRGPFPRVSTLREIADLKIRSWEGLTYMIENVVLAHETGRGDIVRAMKKAIRRYDRAKALEDLDRGVFGGYFRDLRRRYRPYTDRVGFTNGRPDLDF